MRNTITNKEFSNTMPVNKAIQVGTYHFYNCLPLNEIFNNTPDNFITPIEGPPTNINSLILNEKVNIGPLSTFDYIQNKQKFELLKHISISSQKEVGSVILFSNKPFQELSNAHIAVTSTSSTSINLLKLLLKREQNKNISFTPHKYDLPLEDQLNTYDACLYIGDPAIITLHTINLKNIYTYDLASRWYKHTKLPFVFCVWIANKKWSKLNQPQVKSINDLLVSAKEKALKNSFQDSIIKCSQLSKLNTKILVKYFTEQLSYNFTDEHHKALELFESQLIDYKII